MWHKDTYQYLGGEDSLSVLQLKLIPDFMFQLTLCGIIAFNFLCAFIVEVCLAFVFTFPLSLLSLCCCGKASLASTINDN